MAFSSKLGAIRQKLTDNCELKKSQSQKLSDFDAQKKSVQLDKAS
jgi:hypothetical protein